MTAQILSEQQRRLHNIATIGTVFDVNPDDQTMRLDVGDNQTDWLPIPALAAGQVRVWRCPSVGEQFLLVSPSGELANAIPVLSLYSNQHPSPSTDENEIRVQFNDHDYLSVKTDDSNLTLKITNTTIISEGSITLDTPTVTMTGNLEVDESIHAKKDIIAGVISLIKHLHGKVMGGNSTTGAPQ